MSTASGFTFTEDKNPFEVSDKIASLKKKGKGRILL